MNATDINGILTNTQSQLHFREKLPISSLCFVSDCRDLYRILSRNNSASAYSIAMARNEIVKPNDSVWAMVQSLRATA